MKPILDARVQARVLAELAPHSYSFQQLKYVDVYFLNLCSSWVISWLPRGVNLILIRVKSASFTVVSATNAENESSFLLVQTFETDIQHVILSAIF